MDRVRLSRKALDPVCLGLAAKKIDELEARVAVRPLECDKLWDDGKRFVFLRGGDDAVSLHPVEHIAEALLGAIGMAVRAEIACTLGQARQHRGLGKREVLGRFPEIAA